MSAFSQYEAIQDLKRSQKVFIGDVNYAKVIAPHLYNTSPSGLIKNFALSLFFSTRIIEKNGTESPILFFYSCRHKKRPDYDYIIQHLYEVTQQNTGYVESTEKLSGIQLLRTLAKLPSTLMATSGYRASLLQKLSAALLIAKYLSSTRKALSALLDGRKKVITFCDAQPSDNLLAQLASARGISTITAQHGQYRGLGKNNMSPDAEAYTNFVSDRMLCWGEATCAEYRRLGFGAERFIVTGWIRQWSDPRATPSCQETGIFGVTLNGENGKESNIPLIEAANLIARALSLRYLIRLHPLNKPGEYHKLVGEHCAGMGRFNTSEYIEKVDFNIAHMSGAVIEMLHVGSPVYLLDDGRLADIFRVPGLSYADAQAIIKAVRADMSASDRGRSRLSPLSRWYNDDNDQARRIRRAILGEDS